MILTDHDPMLRGHLDNLTSLGYLEGWAFDTEAPNRPLTVSVSLVGKEIAWGLAHRFRSDLMAEGCGLGWCAFRLRLEGPVDPVRTGRLKLSERGSGRDIILVNGISVTEDAERPLSTVEAMTHADPTVISDIGQLRRCEPLMLQFIQQQGVEAFLSAAYAYVLQRPADDSGLTLYTRHIRHATLGPIGILEALADSDEFRSRPRFLPAPNTPAFPFA